MQVADIADSEWKRILAVFVDAPDVPPMLGGYQIEGKELSFSPSFPLRPGMKYRAVFDPAALAAILTSAELHALPQAKIERAISLPASDPAPATTVTAIYPSSETLPENQLKFYIHFSAPMSRGEAYDRVRLEKASGELVPIPFLELSEELWDVDQQRFTIFFEPGRIKRGVELRNEIGPALVAGEDYVLVVDGDWRDAHGNSLGEDYRKTFRTGPMDVTQPDPHQWKLTPPPAGSREALVVEFNEPLDHAMLHRVIRVINEGGRELIGEIAVDREETRWSFTPAETWTAGKHELLVAGVLEDRAGNSVGKPFEVRLENRDEEVLQEVRVPFAISE